MRVPNAEKEASQEAPAGRRHGPLRWFTQPVRRTGKLLVAAVCLLPACSAPEEDAHTIVAPLEASATVAEPRPTLATLEGIIGQTGAVIEATVAESVNDYSEENGPWTTYALSDVVVHLGTFPKGMLIRQVGGTYPDGKRLGCSAVVPLAEGERYLLFLRNGNWTLSPVLAQLVLRITQVGQREVIALPHGSVAVGFNSSGIVESEVVLERKEGNGEADRLAPAATLPTSALARGGFISALKYEIALRGLSVRGSVSQYSRNVTVARGVRTVRDNGAVQAAPEVKSSITPEDVDP